MTKKHRIWTAVLIALLVLTALSFSVLGRLRGSKTKASGSGTVTNPTKIRRDEYVRRSRLSPKLVWHLNALGDRLEKPGRERLSINGTLNRAHDAQSEEVDAVLEFPKRLRLTTQKGNQRRVFSFDGERVKAVANQRESVDPDLLETLVYGSAEHFFTAQMEGRATRFLGSRFRIDDGATADYNGPYYEVYKVEDHIITSGEPRERLKLYYFNSETLLLERVAYEINRNGAVVKIEETLGGWTKHQGQQVARRIERFENGESVFVLTVRAAGLSPRADDGTFVNN